MIQYPYPIPYSSCCYCSTFHTICAYCTCPGYKTFLQIDYTGHNDLPTHLQSQTNRYDETGKRDKSYCCHCHLYYWNQPPTTEELNSAIIKAEYAILKNK